MGTIVTVSGSPSSRSRTTALLRQLADQAAARGHTVRTTAVRDLPPGALLTADTDDPAVRRTLQDLASADAVVLGTPVYKAAYTGLLKAWLDLLPGDALRGRVVLPVATGAAPTHALAVDYALRPVLAALGAETVLRSLYVVDRRPADGAASADAPPAADLADAVERLDAALRGDVPRDAESRVAS